MPDCCHSCKQKKSDCKSNFKKLLQANDAGYKAHTTSDCTNLKDFNHVTLPGYLFNR